MPGEAACAGRRGPDQARRTKRVVCAGSVRGWRNWGAPGHRAVAARRAATGGELGNQIGIMTVTVPATGAFSTRVTRTAEITRERKSHARGASAALFVPVFLLLARTGLLRWFASHQRVVQTFVTNLHGPDDQLTFGGAVVQAIIPIPSTTGNVTVTFAAVSYAGTLRITILSDPARMPDAPALAAALRHELSAPVLPPWCS